MAETRGRNPDQHLAVSGRVELHLFDRERFRCGIGGLNAHPIEHRSLDLHPCTLLPMLVDARWAVDFAD
jgi:hypothetical protein